MLKNNYFKGDIDGNRILRVDLLSPNIDTYTVELEIAGADLAACQSASVDWMTILTTAKVTGGESQGFTEELKNALDAAHRYYVAAKAILTVTIKTVGNPDGIDVEYGFDGNSPWDFQGLYSRIGKWLETHARLVAAGDPRVVPAPIVAELNVHLDEINKLWHDAQAERRKKSLLYDSKRALFESHCYLLAFVLAKAKMKWGADDPRLADLGFVPKSEIWTKKRPPSLKNFRYDNSDGIFIADAIEDATEYELECRLAKTTGAWTQIYKGAENHTDAKPASSGTYNCRIRAWKDDVEGRWSAVIVVDL